jgi:hypothetical protein
MPVHMRRLVHSVMAAVTSFAIVIAPVATVAAPAAAATTWCQTVTSHIDYKFTVLTGGVTVAQGTTMNSEQVCWDNNDNITGTGAISHSQTHTLGTISFVTKTWHDVFFTGDYEKGAYVTWTTSGTHLSWTCTATWSHENLFDPVNGPAINWGVRAVVDSTSSQCTQYTFTKRLT